MIFDFAKLDSQQRYKLLSSTITLRPIAWVSSLNDDGQLNAAPFSYFNVFGEEPPVLGFSILHRSEVDIKDTGRNIRHRGEFVVNLVSEDTLKQMNITAIDFPPGMSEIAEAGLSAADSSSIETPRIAESRVSFECKLRDIVPLGAMRSLVLGDVLAMHIDDDAVLDAARCWVDTPRLDIIGRTAVGSYVRTSDVLKIPAIPLKEWDRKQGGQGFG